MRSTRVSRSFSYVLGRPWRWFFYNLVGLVYGAFTYLLVGAAILLTVWVTHHCVGLWVVREAAPGLNRFDAIFPPPQFGQFPGEVEWSQLGLSAKITAGLILFWIYAAMLLLAAYAVNFYFSINTWIYLLLRRSADGTEFDDVYIREVTDSTAGTENAPESPTDNTVGPDIPDESPEAKPTA